MDGLNTLEIFYLFCALLGGILVVFRMIMQVLGAADVDMDSGGGVGGDMGGDVGGDVGGNASGHDDSDAGFKLLSMHGLSSFMLMFGLVGYIVYHNERAGVALSLVAGSFAGYISVWIIKRIFDFMIKMQSSGTLEMSAAVGAEGEVYLTIPKGGAGKVMVNFCGRLREFEAMSENGEEMKTGVRIKVVRISGSTLMVDRMV